MNAKAFIVGTIITISLVIGSQLVFVLVASYLSIASENNAFIQENKELMWFILGAGAYSLSLFIGGMITSALTDKNKIIHAGLVGLLVAVLSILTSGDLSELNYKAIIMIAAGLACGAFGGRIERGSLNTPSEES